jgi:hypothetical protein
MYLPPYSPDFNPIEKAFAVIKSNLKRTQPLTNSPEDTEVIQEKASDIFTPDLMEALFRDCGYWTQNNASMGLPSYWLSSDIACFSLHLVVSLCSSRLCLQYTGWPLLPNLSGPNISFC